MKVGDLLFVYGSLRKGEVTDLSLQSGAEFVCEDRINGDLYKCGWYPGMKSNQLDNEYFWNPKLTSVRGEVYRITDDKMIRHLDAYEGYPLLFDRREFQSMNGNRVWAYTFNNDVNEENRVPSGDWVDFKAQKVETN